MDQLYTVKEMAEAFKMQEAYLRREIKNEHLEAYRLGNEFRISEKAIRSFLDSKSTFPEGMRKKREAAL